ncbi:protein mono-ADP-ribosyltransferase PARP14-like [Dendronephthya gigantea]|uniref:protein mono-ADP-ribosyltransferase PARP14-like n=1 Tax=Dendronephthya gigantea TaxID=151771 RepID=UPI00106A43E5|nr:protein mono-ADP-ribosyltransferase PARP14-like [Dendronephthya gigantea]
MSTFSEQSQFNSKRTIVVLNVPSCIVEEDLIIHFQKAKYGGGDVDDVVKVGSDAFVTFDSVEDARRVLSHPMQTIENRKVEIQNYEVWFTEKKKQEETAEEREDGRRNEDENGVKTIFVSGIKKETTKDSICLFFENKRRTNGGDLCEGKEGYKRISPTVARLTFVSPEDVQNILRKANKETLQLDGNVVNVSTDYEPTYYRSVLLAKNLNPKTGEETLKNFVEATKNTDVWKVVLGKDNKAIVILKSDIDEEPQSESFTSEISSDNLELEESVISLEFAPLTRSIRVTNIPQDTSRDAIKYKFKNPKIGGGRVTDVKMDEKNGVAIVGFEESSVVSELVKREHRLNEVCLAVIPYYDDFEERPKVPLTFDFSSNYRVKPSVMDYIKNNKEIEKKKFDLKSTEYDEEKSIFHFTKEFDDHDLAKKFEALLHEFLDTFDKDEIRIPKPHWKKVKETIEGKREEFDDAAVDLIFDNDNYSLSFVGKKRSIGEKKHLVEMMIDQLTAEANIETRDLELPLEGKNKLRFMNFIGYFEKLMGEFPEIKIHGIDGSSGKLSLVGRPEKARELELRILQDIMKISEIEVPLSHRQVAFLKLTDCQLVNEELNRDDVMLMVINTEGRDAKDSQAKLFSLRKYDTGKAKLLKEKVKTKTSETCVEVDEKTAEILTKSGKLQRFTEEMSRKQVLIDSTDPCNIWIVCERSRISNVERELGSLTDEKKISSEIFKLRDPMKYRFLKEHCFDNQIKKHEKRLEKEGVSVNKTRFNTIEVIGTPLGRKQMMELLSYLAKSIESRVYHLTEPGMKKQMSVEATKAIISGIEKDHRCVIKRGNDESAVLGHGMIAKSSGVAEMNLPYASMCFVNDKQVKMSSGQTISIVVGDLAQQKVDVIVNSSDEKVNLKATPCGKALLNVAGDELLTECQKIGLLELGDLALTGPAKLNCKFVFHVRASPYECGRGVLVLQNIIKKCLAEMGGKNLTSIAFPAIGSGNLGFPRRVVTEILFKEMTDFFTMFPKSPINDIRFVAYSKDQGTIGEFLGAVQEIKSMTISSAGKNVPISTVSTPAAVNDNPATTAPSGANNVTTNEKPDGTLELCFGTKNLTVQIVCADISKETTDLIMHVINQGLSFQGGVGKALIIAGGDSIVEETRALGKPAPFSTLYTKAGSLAVNQIAHVIAPASISYTELKKCLDNFFADVSAKNIAKISLSAIGAGAMGFSETQSAALIFDNLLKIANTTSGSLNLVRIVILEKIKCIRFKDAAKAFFASGGAVSGSTLQKAWIPTTGGQDTSVTIYSDDRRTCDRAWGELRKNMKENIKEINVPDDNIKKFTDGHIGRLVQLERRFDVKIKVDQTNGSITIIGHHADISTIQEEIRRMIIEILKKDISVSQPSTKLPSHWDTSLNAKVNRVKLVASSKEYKDVETEFRKTVPNQIVSIERVQNKEQYELYDLKRRAMMAKYGSNFAGKEKMLFHGTPPQNVDKINYGGLNRSFAVSGASHGQGVYFARDASYSVSTRYSPPDPQTGLRYMYYVNVLVGEYAVGNSGMKVAPTKSTANPNEKFDSVVDNLTNPVMYILFQDYDYYPEYLITFK